MERPNRNPRDSGELGDTLSEEDVLRYLSDVTRSGTMMAEVFEQSLLKV